MNTNIQPTVAQLQINYRYVTLSCMTEDHEKTEFARRINEICDDMNVPPKGKARQLVLAKQFGVTQQAARKWLERESFPAILMGKRIATWAGASFDWLMTGDGEKRPGGENPLLARYRSADPATRTLIDIALAHPDQPMPPGLSPSLRVMVDMVRTAISNELPPGNA